MTIEVSPTGKLVKGTVFDCNKKSLERSLKAIDKELYLKWNPEKRDGYGCWELWRNPTKKELVKHGQFQGVDICTLEYRPKSLVHHILDMNYLTYEVIEHLKKCDGWENKQLLNNMHWGWINEQDNKQSKREQQIRDYIKDHKSEMKEFYELCRSGVNPAWFFADHKQKI